MYARTQLLVGIVRGANCTAYAAKGPTEGGGGSTGVILDAGPTRMTAHARGLTPGHH
jgi:hypothetical protein